MRHLTHITHHGFNILGLLEIFVFIGILMALPWLDDFHPIVRPALALIAVLGLATFDFVWRWLQDVDAEDFPISGWRLAFSPHLGGCAFFVPCWLLIGMIPVALTVAIVLFPSQRHK